jgi:outer membrane receptor protein involved in Fe transport
MGSISADYRLPIGTLEPTVGAVVQRISDRTASFDASPSFPQYRLPAYTTVDLRAGLTVDTVTTQFYVRNLFDEEGQLSVLFPQFGGRVAVMQPRTYGVNVMMSF